MIATASPTKRCPRCGRVLPLTAEYWNRNKTRADGFGDWCKECTRAYNKTPEQWAYDRAYEQDNPKGRRITRLLVIDALGDHCTVCGAWAGDDGIKLDIHHQWPKHKYPKTLRGKEKQLIAAIARHIKRTGEVPPGFALACHNKCHAKLDRERRLARELWPARA